MADLAQRAGGRRVDHRRHGADERQHGRRQRMLPGVRDDHGQDRDAEEHRREGKDVQEIHAARQEASV